LLQRIINHLRRYYCKSLHTLYWQLENFFNRGFFLTFLSSPPLSVALSLFASCVALLEPSQSHVVFVGGTRTCHHSGFRIDAKRFWNSFTVFVFDGGIRKTADPNNKRQQISMGSGGTTGFDAIGYLVVYMVRSWRNRSRRHYRRHGVPTDVRPAKFTVQSFGGFSKGVCLQPAIRARGIDGRLVRHWTDLIKEKNKSILAQTHTHTHTHIYKQSIK